MAYNHGFSKAKFDSEWNKMEKLYQSFGMSKETISQLREFELDVFRSDRRFAEHSVLFSEIGNLSETLNDETMSIAISDNRSFISRNWTDWIDSSTLIGKVKRLSNIQIRLLTLVFVEQVSIKQAAEMLGLTYDIAKYEWKKIKIFAVSLFGFLHLSIIILLVLYLDNFIHDVAGTKPV